MTDETDSRIPSSDAITDEDRRFLEKRRRFARVWTPIGGFVIVGLVAFAAWAFSSAPLIVDPTYVADRLADGSLRDSTLWLMATLLPVMTVAALTLVLGFVLLGFDAVRCEKRLLDIVGSLSSDARGRAPTG